MTKHTSPPYLCPEGSNPCGRYGYCSYCPHSKKAVAAHVYDCMNRPKPGEPWLQLEDGCGHTAKKSDPSCASCKWR